MGHYLELSHEPVRFEAVSQLTNVFFDDSNRQVFAVRSGGVTGVMVKGPDETTSCSFRMEDKGPVISIKFSPDQRVLAVQRSTTSVEFINFSNNTPSPAEYSQSCRGKSSAILGFVWTQYNEVSLITDHGVELFQVLSERRQLKSLKSQSLNVQWFVWCPHRSLALLASANGAILQPIQFKPGTVTKLPRLEMDAGSNVVERDVTLGELYGSAVVLILRHIVGRTTEVHVYTLGPSGVRKSHVLRLGFAGRFAINIVDDLVIVHHQASKTSLLFDIALSGEVDGGVTHHAPVAPARPLKPCVLRHNSLESAVTECDLYSPNWVVFQPNIVIDARLGCLWYVKLQLTPLCPLVPDRPRLVELLLQRTNGKLVLVNVIRDLLMTNDVDSMLPVLVDVFEKLNTVYKSWLDSELQSQMGTVASLKPPPQAVPPRVLIDQQDMYSHVFAGLQEVHHTAWVLICYLKSLSEHNIPAGHALTELLVTTLVRRGKFGTLQQMLQYGTLADSKPLACLLLSLANLHPAATQLAQDMLSRLNAQEEMLEVLLSQGQVLQALRLARTLHGSLSLPARKFLEAAQNENDPTVFHAVFTFFQQRNLKLRNSSSFGKGDHCESYVRYYNELFPKEC